MVASKQGIIWICVYAIIRFAGHPRTPVLKGPPCWVIIGKRARLLGAPMFSSGSASLTTGLAFLAIGLVVIFQPELRPCSVRLGRLFFPVVAPKEIALVMTRSMEARKYLSKRGFGPSSSSSGRSPFAWSSGGTDERRADVPSTPDDFFFPGSALHPRGW